jgi:predicted O-methyltransferase YrrM
MKNDRNWYPGAAEDAWVDGASGPLHPVLAAIEAAAEPVGVPILDRAGGRVLAALAANRRRIVEVGTAYGYSTLCMALAQPPDGTIVTIDPDRSRTDLARAWWREAGLADERITVVSAPALEAFAADDPALAGPFDLAFIDALKPEYPAYLEALLPRLVPGALVTADNVLQNGRVAADVADDEAGDSVRAIRAFNRSVLTDPRFVATILPVGDGLLLATFRG